MFRGQGCEVTEVFVTCALLEACTRLSVAWYPSVAIVFIECACLAVAALYTSMQTAWVETYWI